MPYQSHPITPRHKAQDPQNQFHRRWLAVTVSVNTSACTSGRGVSAGPAGQIQPTQVTPQLDTQLWTLRHHNVGSCHDPWVAMSHSSWGDNLTLVTSGTPHVSLTWLAVRGPCVIWNNWNYAMCPRWDGWAPLGSGAARKWRPQWQWGYKLVGICHRPICKACGFFIRPEVIIIITIIIFTATLLSPGGSGYFTYKQSMKLVTTKFKSGGLHEKHVVATWNVGNHLSICF